MIQLGKRLLNFVAAAWVLSLALSLYLIFFYAPVDQALGISQKIFYVHLGAASATSLCVLVAFINSVRFLLFGSFDSDDWACACAELTVMFGLIVLVTGMIWARIAWGVFLPLSEIKLLLFLLLWVIFVAYLILRKSFDSLQKKATGSAVFAVLGSLVMPFVVLATRFFDLGFQLHPNVIKTSDAGMPARMLVTLLVSICSWLLLAVLLTCLVGGIRNAHRQLQFGTQ